ncbi:hypothetical protein EDB19DRAFT_1834699 [Suillus lakei]|nr:hypothetical protein EDB19DRAFT_1834699 [Suillus lakei]
MRLGKLGTLTSLPSRSSWAATSTSTSATSTSISASTSATSNPSSNDTALSSCSPSCFFFSFGSSVGTPADETLELSHLYGPDGMFLPLIQPSTRSAVQLVWVLLATAVMTKQILSSATAPLLILSVVHVQYLHFPQASTDYGVVVPGSGRLGQAYSGDGVPAHASSEMVGHIMPPGELLRIEDEEESEDLLPPRMHSASHPSLPEHIVPLLPLPPFEGTVTRKPSDRSLLNEKEKSVPSASYPTSDLEDSKVFTTRRVRVQELGSGSPQDDDSTNTQPAAAPGSRRNSSRLRQSCFGSSSSRSGSNLCRGSDKDEAAQSLLGRRLGVGYTPAGGRPMSSMSAKSAVSGNIVCHDAVSRIGTPVSLPSRAITPASQRGSEAPVMDFAPPMPSGAPPAYGSRGPSPLSPTCIDVLDIPVLAPFSYASTSGRPLPPGLVPLSSRHAWRDSLSVITGSSNGADITVYVLDAEPPRAGDGWRSLAGGFLGVSTGPDPSEQRTTFVIPQVTHKGNPMVFERGSAHSRVATTSSASLNSGRPLGPISPSVSAFGHTDPSRYMFHTAEEYEDPFAEPGSRTSILGPMPSFSTRSVLSKPMIRSVDDTTVTSDDTEVTRALGEMWLQSVERMSACTSTLGTAIYCQRNEYF